MKAIFTVFLLLGLLSCTKHEAQPDCGCDSPVAGVLTDELGIYYQIGLIETLSTDKHYTGSYTLACNPDFVKGQVTDKDTVVLSGKYYQPCYPAGDDLLEHPGLLELTAIRKR